MRFLDIFQVLAERGFGRKNARVICNEICPKQGPSALRGSFKPMEASAGKSQPGQDSFSTTSVDFKSRFPTSQKCE